MIRWLLPLLAAFTFSGTALAADDQGRFVEIAAAPSTQPAIAPPHVTVWLPPGYQSSRRRYGVVYMQDGQNVFFADRAAFGHVWAADKSLLRLIAAKRIAPVIVVAIDNPGGTRYRQYFPQALYAAATPALRDQFDALAKGRITGDAYVAFLTHDLKPMIDRRFRTLSDAAHTAIVGSSMGGLISCYAFVRAPIVFGKAACVSTHWPLADPQNVGPFHPELAAIWKHWLDAHLGAPRGRKLWMDHGTATLDAAYAPWQDAIDGDLTALGWRRGRDFVSRTYPGASHEEKAWAARLDDIFAWLLARPGQGPIE